MSDILLNSRYYLSKNMMQIEYDSDFRCFSRKFYYNNLRLLVEWIKEPNGSPKNVPCKEYGKHKAPLCWKMSKKWHQTFSKTGSYEATLRIETPTAGRVLVSITIMWKAKTIAKKRKCRFIYICVCCSIYFNNAGIKCYRKIVH